ncbi:hypothetical protein ABC383_06055 [Noviherbaspirillum sp. 1P10PC]|uniref:hypothetical protein n=1 Tax=Noviherbaspirillum sp. 1P10PC TaxID=3132292 RepID=UPI0039A172E4
MKRLLVIFLLFLLPCQISWAAIDSLLYGQQENVESAHSDLPAQVFSEDSQPDGKMVIGCHCHGLCHLPVVLSREKLAPVGMLTSVLSKGLSPTIRYQSHIPDGPTRPKWRTVS